VRVVCQAGASALHQSNTASPVHLAHLDQLDITENLECPARKVNLDHLAHQPTLALNPTARVSPAHLAPLDLMALTDKPDQWDHLDNLDPTGNQDLADLPAQLGLPAMLVHPATQDLTGNQDHPAKTANACTIPPDPKDPTDLPDPVARTATPDQQVNPASPDQWDQWAKLEIQATLAKTDNQDHQVDPEFPERTHITVPALTVPPSSSRRQPSTLKLFNDCTSNDLISNLDLNRTISYCNISSVVYAVMLLNVWMLKVNTRKRDER